MTSVYFVRHAEPDHAWADDRTRPLTEQGRQDARKLVDFFATHQIDAFLSSPYVRSYETILPVAAGRNMRIETDEDFRERKVGTGLNDYQVHVRRWQDKHFAEENGESIAMVQERNIRALSNAIDRFAGQTFVIATHGTALSSIVNHYDPLFGFDDFMKIVDLMPYVLKMTFDGQRYLDREAMFFCQRQHIVKADDRA